MGGGSSRHQRTYDQMMHGSFKSGSNKSFDLMGIPAFNGSYRSLGGSMHRSNSFPDNMNSDSFRYDGDNKSSAMSIGSIMDLQSDASSTQWFQAAIGSLPHPDERSFASSAIM